MATKVKGITIELGADASGLEKALKNINQELSSTQKQLNSVNKSLKLDPSNLELIEQKQRLLATAIDQTTSKLRALKQAQDKIGSEGGSQDQYDALTREISDTQAKLSGLNQEQRRFASEAAAAQVKSTALSQGLSKVGSTAQQVAQQTMAISAAAGAALAAMAGLAVSAAKQADEWLTLSQQTGLSTDAIQKFAYAAEQIDVPLPTITSAITKMKGHLDSSSDVWDQIGVKVKNQQGQYRAIEDIFFETVTALGNIENETERDTMAMKIFGRSANELAGLIDDGGKKMKQLGQEAEDIGAIVSEEDLEKLGQFDDLLEQMKSQMKAASMQAAIPVMEALAPLVEKVAEGIRTLAQVLSAIPTPIIQILAVVLGIVAILAPVALGIAAIANSINTLITVLPGLASAIAMCVSQATTLIGSNPYVVAVLAIIAVIGLLVYAIYEVVDNWDAVSAAAETSFNSAKQSAQNFLNSLQGVGQGIANVFKDIPQIVENLGGVFGQLVGKIVQVVSKILSVFKELADKARNAGKEVMDKFTSGVQAVIGKVTQAFQSMADAIKGVFNSMEMDASWSGSRVASSFASAYNMSANTTRLNSFQGGGATANIGTSFLQFLGGGGGGGYTSLVDSLNALATNSGGTTNVTVELVGSAKNIFDTVRVQNNTLTKATGYHALS